MHTLLRKVSRLHWLLVVTMFAIIAWGVWAIYNASSFREGQYLAGLWRSQLQWAAFGAGAFLIAALVDYKWVRWGGWLLYLGGIAVLAFPYLFEERQGSRGMVAYWHFNLPGSQISSMTTVLTLAVVLGHLHLKVPLFGHHWMRIVAAGGLVVIPMGALLKQPDLGAVLALGLVLGLMLLVASIPWRYLTVLFVGGMCLLPLWYQFGLKPYQKKRVEVFGQMLTNQRVGVIGDAYMADKVKIAVGSAGFEGKGPMSSKVEGRSVHRTFFTATESVDDFIYAVIVEEFGFWGGLFQILLLSLLLFQGVHVAYWARDEMGRLLVAGIVGMLFVLSMQHMGMNVLMLPIMGQPLPFTSYGGTFLIICMFLMGMVQSVWIHRQVSAAGVEPEGKSDENVAVPVTEEGAVSSGMVKVGIEVCRNPEMTGPHEAPQTHPLPPPGLPTL